MMSKHAVPRNPDSQYIISQPVPNVAYGYLLGAFDESRQIQLSNARTDAAANAEGLFYSFFVIEMRAHSTHGGGGGIYLATNQCLGDSASCAKLADDLFVRLRSCQEPEVPLYNNAAFSIAMHGTETLLFISWKADDYKYYMQRTNNYLLQRPEELQQFLQHVLNILDWG